jgi:hypothetical protein
LVFCERSADLTKSGTHLHALLANRATEAERQATMMVVRKAGLASVLERVNVMS